MASAARNSSGINGGSCSASSFASTGDFRGKLRVKWFWLMTELPSCSRDHAAVEHLVQHGRSDLINERNTRFRIVPQYIQRYLLLLRWRLALLRLQLIAGRRLKLLDHLVSRGVHKHTLRSRDTGSDQG